MREFLKDNNMSLTRNILILINFIFAMISGYKKIFLPISKIANGMNKYLEK